MQIYIIRNLVNGKRYIGKDSVNRQNYFGSGVLIKAAIRKYGKDNFEKIIVGLCDTNDKLNFLEKFYITFFKTKIPNGYNLTDGGEGTSGWHPDEETRKEWSRQRQGNTNCVGRILSEETKDKISKAHFGQKMPEEFCLKMSQRLRGNQNAIGLKHTEESKRKISDGNKKWIRSKKYCEAISLRLKGRTLSDEIKKKISLAKKGCNGTFTGRHHTEEAKQKNRLAHLKLTKSIE